jgi:phosphoesterase, MJ0936 family
MKIGIITDIHNNVVALKTVMQKLQHEKCDGIICCGDIIGTGAYPEETVSEIMKIPNMLACVKGNHESYLTDGMPTEIPNDEHMDAEEMEHHKWEHNLLSEKSKKFIENLNYEERLTINNKQIHVTHYPTDFEYTDADIVLYGHEHKPLIQTRDGKYYINCGSLGCPAKDKNIARAGILIIDDNISFDVIKIEYDVTKVLEDMDRIDYPAKNTIKKIFFGV